MSYPFEYGDETIWDAGYHSGKLYASLVPGAARFLDVPSGLTPTPQGGCAVDRELFQVFVERLYGLYTATSNEVLRELAHGLLITSLVLLDRTDGTIELRPEDTAPLNEAKSDLARSMAS
ncbi:DUF6086 family protein [Streptomyces sp. SID13726]|uniref:DUF6086 family protein n=1 Tax=Streptomyces sp. SID13726 TaxID=2706058 RepID=UPI0013B99419|nr:DUF6086 family protein [Streptomyces sp. SID13726]NEB03759.1 hypothetical protein [Streptomyces sp. SID13726]